MGQMKRRMFPGVATHGSLLALLCAGCTGDEYVADPPTDELSGETEEANSDEPTPTDTTDETDATDGVTETDDGSTETDDGSTETDEPTDDDEPTETTDSEVTGDVETDVDDGPGPNARLIFENIPLEDDPTFLTHFEFVPGSDELFAITRHGEVLHYQLKNDVSLLLGQFHVPGINTDADCGLIGLALDPDFGSNRALYISQCFSLTESGVVRYVLNTADYERTIDSGVRIIAAEHSDATQAIHNVGKISFDPDGNMYTAFGEKGRGSLSRDPRNVLGALVRFRPLPEGGHAPPTPPNPDFGGQASHGLAYAIGFRSPWTVTRDNRGRFWVGDIGSNGDDSYEEVNLVSAPEQDFGWNRKEGPCISDCGGVADPIRSWKRRPTSTFELEDPEVASPNARVVWVGPQYRETTNDRYDGLLTDRILYGDLCLGFVRGVIADENGEIVDDRHLGHAAGITAWQVREDGYLYGISYERCTHSEGSQLPPGKLLKAFLDPG